MGNSKFPVLLQSPTVPEKPTLPGDSFRQTPGKAVVLPKSEHGHTIAPRLCELHVTDFSPEMPCVYPSPFPELLDD